MNCKSICRLFPLEYGHSSTWTTNAAGQKRFLIPSQSTRMALPYARKSCACDPMAMTGPAATSCGAALMGKSTAPDAGTAARIPNMGESSWPGPNGISGSARMSPVAQMTTGKSISSRCRQQHKPCFLLQDSFRPVSRQALKSCPFLFFIPSESLRLHKHPSLITLISENQPFPICPLLSFRDCSIIYHT